VVADKLKISLNAMTWGGRIALLVIPPLAYYLTNRICLGLQQHDREVLAHGVESGIIRRDPDGRFYEVHQPLAAPGAHGHAELEYKGWVVPKKMNRVGALLPGLRGFFFPIEKSPDGSAAAPVSPAPKHEEIGSR